MMLLAPGDPMALLAFDPTMRHDERERLAITALGVSDPFYMQYLRWLIGDDWMMVDTNLDGRSRFLGRQLRHSARRLRHVFQVPRFESAHLIAERLGATIELNVAGSALRPV